tara:strand:- start:2366 stop:2719 length:354 start_codon:yes stop_codon:yes gene_type:complete
MDWLTAETREEFENNQELNNDLSRSFSGGKRTKVDRYRDFSAVFNGTDQGKRVLYEILAWAGIYRPSTPDRGPIDVHRVFEDIGRKKMGLEILAVLNKEPKPIQGGAANNTKGALNG